MARLRHVSHFPNEHWYGSKIKESFAGFCEVAEIDLACLTGDNFGPIRLLLEVNERLEIPYEVRVSAKEGIGRDGAVARVLPIRVWPRRDQLDDDGNLIPFFHNPPPALSVGPQLGPTGLVRRLQQRMPPQHPANRLFPPRDIPAGDGAQLASTPTAVASQAQTLGLALTLARILAPLSLPSAHAGTQPLSPTGAQEPDSPRLVSSGSAKTSSVFSFDFNTTVRESPPSPTPLVCPAQPRGRGGRVPSAPV
jgi:hypothetical protein